ncbi:hypothetical protein [Nocardia aurantia]|uniref:Proteinase inhibitor I42 chagasin domain-containing protein n=1 Tax=Nocardia aurantia TaxID=2585199 RepID=A0A7K0DV51_9NOCA|nr:hypothetical protein [Nocardia aurantia]MQY29646.1 hypothetical protein [Nocardia aurantia]
MIGTVGRITSAALLATALPVLAVTPAPAVADGPEIVGLQTGDDGRTIMVAPGDEIHVRFFARHNEHETWIWDVPTTGRPDVLYQTHSTTESNGDSSATYLVVGQGLGDLTAHRRCGAEEGHHCPPVTLPWKVLVFVR